MREGIEVRFGGANQPDGQTGGHGNRSLATKTPPRGAGLRCAV